MKWRRAHVPCSTCIGLRSAGSADMLSRWRRLRRWASRRPISSCPAQTAPSGSRIIVASGSCCCFTPGTTRWYARNSSAPTGTARMISRRLTPRSSGSRRRTWIPTGLHRQEQPQRAAAGRRGQGGREGLQRVLIAPGDEARGDRDRRAGDRPPSPRPSARARLSVGRRLEGRVGRTACPGCQLGAGASDPGRLARGYSATSSRTGLALVKRADHAVLCDTRSRWYPAYMAINTGRTARSMAKSLNSAAPAAVKPTRGQAAANALASVRAEGLDPGVAEPLLARWASEEITDAQLDEGILRIAARESLTDLLGPVHP